MSKSFSTTLSHRGALKGVVSLCAAFCSSLCPRAERDGRNLCLCSLTHLRGCPGSCPRAAQGAASWVESNWLYWVTCTRSFGEFVAELQTCQSQSQTQDGFFLFCFLILHRGAWSYFLWGAFNATIRLFLRPPVVCECLLWEADTCIAFKEIKIQRLKKVIVAPTAAVFTQCFWRSEVQCNYRNQCTLLAINMMQCSNLQNVCASAMLCSGRLIW